MRNIDWEEFMRNKDKRKKVVLTVKAFEVSC